MKRFFVFLSLLVLFAIPALADIPDISSLTSRELLILKDRIEESLISKGIFEFVEITKNDSGEHVIRLQKRLALLGFFTGDETGKFDSKTITAMKAFEKINRLKADGIASVSDQTLAFSDAAAAKPTPTPKPSKKPTPIPKPTPTPDPRKTYGKFDYDSAARYPDYYKGDRVKIAGKVVQVLGDKTNGFELRVATKGGYDNVVYIFTKGGLQYNILEDDKINFYCRLSETVSYETIMGATVTIPAAVCDFFEFR